VVKIRKSDKIK